MIHKRQVRGQGERGAVIVESGLILLAFFYMLLAIFDFGQFLFVHQAMVQRARNAARNGVVNNYTDTQVQSLVLYDNIAGTGTAFFGLTPTMVQVASSSADTDDARLEVKIVDFQYKIITPLLGNTYTAPTITVQMPRGMYN
jgi:Flp pilus assembly protein TadG